MDRKRIFLEDATDNKSLMNELIERQSYDRSIEKKLTNTDKTKDIFQWFCSTHVFRDILMGKIERSSGLSNGRISNSAEIAIYRQIAFAYTAQIEPENSIILSPYRTFLFYKNVQPSIKIPDNEIPGSLRVSRNYEDQIINNHLNFNSSYNPSESAIKHREGLLQIQKSYLGLHSEDATIEQLIFYDADIKIFQDRPLTKFTKLPYTRNEFFTFSKFIISHAITRSYQHQIEEDFHDKNK